jgi:hypothetical protein
MLEVRTSEFVRPGQCRTGDRERRKEEKSAESAHRCYLLNVRLQAGRFWFFGSLGLFQDAAPAANVNQMNLNKGPETALESARRLDFALAMANIYPTRRSRFALSRFTY